MIEVLHGDCIEHMVALPECSVDAVVCDPPYHLQSIQKRFANSPRTEKTERYAVGAYGRHAKGFMGKEWDGGDIAMRPETWAETLRLLKPGGHLIALCGTRTEHRVVCAIEDAGFEIRDRVLWLYGSGFPKSHNQHGEWEGWGTALKPAVEIGLLARKPLIGTVAANLAEHGTGALNIDGCRIASDGENFARPATYNGEHEGWHRPWKSDPDSLQAKQVRKDAAAEKATALGRWPANVVHDGSEEVLAAFPGAPGQLVDASTNAEARKTQNVYGAMKRGNGRDGEASADRRYTDEGGTNFAALPGQRRGDSGSAARFFYAAKASADDRHGSKHPTVKPVSLMRWLVRLVTPPGGTVLDPFAGSGTTGIACIREGFNAILIEREAEYIADINRRIAALDGSDTPLFAREAS